MSVEVQQFSLEIPAQPEFVRIIRLVVAGVGNALCFNVEEIEDLKLAVGEACYQVFQEGVSLDSRLRVSSYVNGAGVEFEVCLDHGGESLPPRFLELEPSHRSLGLTLMKTLVDEIAYTSNSTFTRIKLVKHRVAGLTPASAARA